MTVLQQYIKNHGETFFANQDMANAKINENSELNNDPIDDFVGGDGDGDCDEDGEDDEDADAADADDDYSSDEVAIDDIYIKKQLILGTKK